MTTLTCDAARDLAVRLAPELVGRLEIVPNQPDWPRPPRGCGAYYHPLLVPALDWLAARGKRFESPPGVIVAVRPLTPETLVHELGHAVPPRPPLFAVTAAEFDELRAAQPSALAEVADQIDAGRLQPWDFDHGARWLRMACHLWARADSAGLELRPANVGAARELDHDIGEYRARLGWEPVKFAHKPFLEIEHTPPPDCFTELFERDRETWLSRQSQREEFRA